ncbi:hypothetical protein, partial [Pantoea ananatis]|uniref:hypothetical protein n=1 Tax=Pantoea ananas TaxID=553 RepID=UPI003AFB481C
PATCYLLPATCYLLPATCYLLPATCYLLPATCYLLPATWLSERIFTGIAPILNHSLCGLPEVV